MKVLGVGKEKKKKEHRVGNQATCMSLALVPGRLWDLVQATKSHCASVF